MPAYIIPKINPKTEVYAANIAAFLTLTYPLASFFIIITRDFIFSPHISYVKITDKAVATQCNIINFFDKIKISKIFHE